MSFDDLNVSLLTEYLSKKLLMQKKQHNLPNAYLEGVRLFNEQKFFECHDVLEELWSETVGEERGFYQGLIQAAVSLFHFENNNLTGARKMIDYSLKRLTPYCPIFLEMSVETFLEEMKFCFAEILISSNQYPTGVVLNVERIPQIKLNT